MQAIKFNTQILNGIITIPKRFNDFGNKRVKVILLDEEDSYKNAKEALLAANQIAKETGFEIEYIQSKPLSPKEREKLSALIVKSKAEAQSKKS